MAQASPRWHTPRSPDRWTAGPDYAAALASCGRPPTPWQRRVLDVAGETLDGPGSRFAYDQVILIVGRRCGKTAVEMGVPLARALQGPLELPNGRRVPFHGAHTAQNLTRARDRFIGELADPWRSTLPEPERKARTHLLVNIATTSLELHPDDWRDPEASSIQVFAPTPTSMRSDGLAHIGIDECLVFPKARGLLLLAAASPTQAEFHGLAQMWLMSNVGLAMQSWLPELRDMGRAAVDSAQTEGVCYVEYSIPEDADPADEALWWEHYPALGDGLVDIRDLRNDLRRIGSLEAFAAEYLNQWPGSGGTGAPPIEPETWLRMVRPGASIAPGTTMWGGADIAPDGSDLVLVACGRDSEGRWLAQVARYEVRASQRRAADLLIGWAAARPNLAGVGYDPRTMATAAHWASDDGVAMESVDGQRWGQALRDLTDRVGDGLGHPHAVGDPGGDVLLRHLAAARTKPVDGLELLSRGRSHGPISGVVALMCAVHIAGMDTAGEFVIM
jgi:hypothetical protein